VIEPRAQTVRVYTPEGAERRLRAKDGEVLTAEPVLPGFKLALRELFGSSSSGAQTPGGDGPSSSGA
jgi:Uma2 family endonuclease